MKIFVLSKVYHVYETMSSNLIFLFFYGVQGLKLSKNKVIRTKKEEATCNGIMKAAHTV